jgi:L-lactate dehydrogenase complex protein LldG
MTAAREQILGAVRQAVARHRRQADPVARPARAVIPARAKGDAAQLISRFCEMAEFAGASCVRIAALAAAPTAIAGWVSRQGLGDSLILSSDREITNLPWSTSPRLLVRPGAPRPLDRVSVTGALAGVAETGSVLVASSPTTPNALHFLPEAHIIILRAEKICGGYEEALDELFRAPEIPRAVTLITGPSRTADIEKTTQIGVHGPKRLHIILIDGRDS